MLGVAKKPGGSFASGGAVTVAANPVVIWDFIVGYSAPSTSATSSVPAPVMFVSFALSTS